MHKTRKRRLLGLGALALALAIAAAIQYYPRGLRGPETVAREFLEALVQTPDDLAALRAAGHLGDGDDPLALVDGLPTHIALDYLRARARQGTALAFDVTARNQPAAQRYATVLEVSERGERETPPHRFAISLQQRSDGDWRVYAIGALE